MAKILMINLPYTGHTNPTLGLAKSLVEHGHTVDYILTNKWKGKIEATGANFIPYDDYGDNLSFECEKTLSFRAAYNTALKIGKNYDVIVYEFLFFLGKSLADKLGKPAVRQFTTFALNENSVSYLADRIFKLKILYKCKFLCRFITKRFFAPDISMQEKDFANEIIHNAPNHNIVYTSREFQIFNNEFLESQYAFVGPVIAERSDNQIVPFHKMKNPIIYVSLGTINNKDKKFFQKCIDAFSQSPVSLILSIGANQCAEDFTSVPNNCYIYNYVPQLNVLKCASLFITHGGMNSINEAMYFGVPMLVFPRATDQPANAERIEELGLGKRMKMDSSAVQIRTVALATLNDNKIKNALIQMSNYMKSSGGLEKAVKMVEKSLKDK